MKKDDDAWITIVVLLFLVSMTFVAGFGVGNNFGEWSVKREAYQNGAGHYTADPETGRQIWVWTGKEKPKAEGER